MLRSRLSLVVLASSLFIAGCSGGGTPATPTVTALTFSTSTVVFGSVTQGTAATPIPVTLTNAGNTPINFSAIGLSSTADFSMAGTCSTTASLLAGSSCTLTFGFTPTTTGALTANVTISDNVPGSPQTITLTGTGTTTAFTLSITAATPFSAAVGATSIAQTLTLTNVGTTSITFPSAPSLGGANPTMFAITANTCGSTLAVGGNCAITLTFTPAAVSSYSATLIIAGVSLPSTIPLTGTGTAPATTPTLAFSPSGLTFPSTTAGTSSASLSVAITNNGGAPLNISSIAFSGGTPAAFSMTNNCGSALAANSSCSIYVTFTPTTTGSFSTSVVVTDNAASSPQSFSVTGSAVAPASTLSGTTLTFSTAPTVTSASQSITVTNTGGATLNITGITLGGTNSSTFAETTTCAATLAPAATCTISTTFTPTAATTYSATITLATNAGSPQVITLYGIGTSTSSVYRTLFTTPMSDNSIKPLYDLVNSATKTIDMTMYEMQDTTFLNDLVARCAAGVKVRVIFSQNIASNSSAAYSKLNTTTNCAAENSNNAFTNTHQKTITVDGATTAILSLNLQSKYYSTTRDYGIITNDTPDIAAIQAVFNADWAAGTPYLGTQGASDFNFPTPNGDDLVWSPTSATVDMVAIINNATTTLYIEAEEFSATNIISAISAAATRGVKVVFICENESNDYTSNFATIKSAGASVWYYSSSTGFYIHGKTVVADLGLSTEAVYMGSINYSTASLTRNRELGVYITGNTPVSNPIAATIAATIISDETRAGVTQY